MRVIAGRFKGRRLVAPATSGTRPATDRVREAVFSSLGRGVEGAAVVDLYAGTGSFGIEALSRGARSATFVERDRRALEALRRNLESLDVEVRVETISVERFLAGATGSFDLAFCDPPWSLESAELDRVLEMLRPLIADGSVVVVSRRASDPTPRTAGYTIDDERRYGDARIIRYMASGTRRVPPEPA